MKHLMLMAFALFVLVTACSSHRSKIVKNGDTQPPVTDSIKKAITPENVNLHIADWPSDSKERAQDLLLRLGVPQAVTADMLVWEKIDGSPYHRTILYRVGMPHKNHKDLVEHHLPDLTRYCEEIGLAKR